MSSSNFISFFYSLSKSKKILSSVFIFGLLLMMVFAVFLSPIALNTALAATDASGQKIVIEYFYQPSCGTCKETTPIIEGLAEKYNVTLVKYNVDRPKNYDLLKEKGYPYVPVAYIGNERFEHNKIQDGYLEDYILKVINGEVVPDYSASDSSSGVPEGSADILTIFPFLSVFGDAAVWFNNFVAGSPKIFAYVLGFFAGLSTCLMAMLGFIFVYTANADGKSVQEEKNKRNVAAASKSDLEDELSRSNAEADEDETLSFGFLDAKESILRVLVFAAGLIISYLVLGMVFIIFEKSLSGTIFTLFGYSVSGADLISVLVGIIVIVIGLHLVGLFSLPASWDEKYKNVSRKYVTSYPGLFVLGILFSFVKVPCTFPFLLVLIDKTIETGTEIGFAVSVSDLGMLLIFCLGVITPLLIVGFLGGYALTKLIRKYKKEIRALSGVVSILLGLWVMFY
ncbi:cytochrome c biogenesis protein CcdA [Methanolapillus africanus]